jgi:hypothetical protein
MNQKIIAISAVSVFVLLLITLGMYFGYTNKEISLREGVEAQQQVCQANYDKMFKVISQVAQVPSEFMQKAKEAFKEIYPELMEGRYGNSRGGALMSWITESNPNFDLVVMGRLYEKVQVAVEANREEYFVEQKKLIDIQREHSTFVKRFPARIFVNSEEIEITVVTSTITEKVYETGKDDNIELFK